MRENKKHGFSKTCAWPIDFVMGRANTFFLTIAQGFLLIRGVLWICVKRFSEFPTTREVDIIQCVPHWHMLSIKSESCRHPKRFCPRVSDPTLLDTYGAQLLFFAVVLLCGCHAEKLLKNEFLEQFIPEPKIQTSIDLPEFGSCPDGWSEAAFDAGKGYMIPYCTPPNISELNSDSSLVPSPPNFLPCPSGWTDVEDGTTGLVTCHPYGPEGPEDCARDDETGNIDKIHFPGDSGCVRIGTECPEGLWATNLPGDRPIVYVQAGIDYGEQADGSQTTPFGSIGDAIEHAESDATIALSKGIYDEPVVLQRGMMIVRIKTIMISGT